VSFVSSAFFLFLPLVFLGYWSLQRLPLRLQNLFLLAVSYLFYAWADWRLLAVLVGISVAGYLFGLLIQSMGDPGRKRTFFVVGIVVMVGTLGVFKYCGFFMESLSRLLGSFGFRTDDWALKILLPLGLSFFTLKSLSYLIEVYRGKREATHDWVAYFTYIAFFPQLVAGPIDRPDNLLRQLQQRRSLVPADINSGLIQALWGYFKKAVVADNMAPLINLVFAHYQNYGGLDLMLNAAFFSIQIYCDFSGYSDIATGVARMLGFDSMINFSYPYFSRDIGEFWRRWHISLSSWFRDYLFYPLGGVVGSRWRSIRNILIVFTLSGLWHGANWTYVVWGFCHGLLFVPLILGIQKSHTGTVARKRNLPKLREFGQITLTFALITMLWIVFRSDSLTSAGGYIFMMFAKFKLSIYGIFSQIVGYAKFTGSKFSIFSLISLVYSNFSALSMSFIVILAEWQFRQETIPLRLKFGSRAIRWAIYSVIFTIIVFFAKGDEAAFLYAQF
jgi:alginate O-acetyltransferase complex protein AlgI